MTHGQVISLPRKRTCPEQMSGHFCNPAKGESLNGTEDCSWTGENFMDFQTTHQHSGLPPMLISTLSFRHVGSTNG